MIFKIHYYSEIYETLNIARKLPLEHLLIEMQLALKCFKSGCCSEARIQRLNNRSKLDSSREASFSNYDDAVNPPDPTTAACPDCVEENGGPNDGDDDDSHMKGSIVIDVIVEAVFILGK